MGLQKRLMGDARLMGRRASGLASSASFITKGKHLTPKSPSFMYPIQPVLSLSALFLSSYKEVIQSVNRL